jgi:cysteine-S-conjugate beta-lyase
MTKKRDTIICHAGLHPYENHGVVNPPVYHASTIAFQTVEGFESSDDPSGRVAHYGRTGTPTTFAFEDAVTALHQGHRTVAYPSGLAAIVGTLLTLLQNGDHVLMVDTTYAPTRKRLCGFLLERAGVETTFYKPGVGAGIGDLIRPNTKVVYMESPGSITFEMQDVPAIAEVCRAVGVRTVIDNTWSSPLLFQPLNCGVDFVVEAATKYVVGHSDAMLGTSTVGNEEDYLAIKATANSLGYSAAPDDCYLGARGLRTLSVRLERHQKNALKVAEWLQGQSAVERVLYPALPDDPGYELWKRDHSGASGLFGVILKPGPKSAVAAMLDGLELFGIGASWGGYESLALPTYPRPLRTATEWPYEGPNVRLHIGLEDPDDLIEDLSAGLTRFDTARS